MMWHNYMVMTSCNQRSESLPSSHAGLTNKVKTFWSTISFAAEQRCKMSWWLERAPIWQPCSPFRWLLSSTHQSIHLDVVILMRRPLFPVCLKIVVAECGCAFLFYKLADSSVGKYLPKSRISHHLIRVLDKGLCSFLPEPSEARFNFGLVFYFLPFLFQALMMTQTNSLGKWESRRRKENKSAGCMEMG
jgi:hypothetical protein